MKAPQILLLFICFVSFSNCEKDATISPKPYPFVITLTPGINSNSVTFSAQLLDPGPSSFIHTGFVWSTHDKPTLQDNHVFLENEMLEKTFTYEVNFGLSEGQRYYVRAYIKTGEYEVYGNTQTFISHGSDTPVITSFSPGHGPMGTKVIIYGNNFGVINSELTVKFGDHVAHIDSAMTTRLVVTVPLVTQNELVSISIFSGSSHTTTADSFAIWYPWTQVSTFPNMRMFGYASFEIDGKIYICGGAEFGSNAFMYYVWQYDPIANTWQVIGNVPGEVRLNAIGFSLNGKGYYGLGAPVNTIHSTYLTDIWEFDPQSTSWTLLTNYPDTPVVYQKTFVANNHVFIGPGQYWDGNIGHVVQHLWTYDPLQNDWSQKADFPGKVETGMVSVSAGNRGYMGLGGLNKEIYEYDPSNDAWTILPDYPGEATSYNAGFFINDKFYVGLGATDTDYPENDMWQFDLAQQTWTAMQPCPTRLGPLFNITISNKGYAGLGLYARNFADEVEGKFVYEFDPVKN